MGLLRERERERERERNIRRTAAVPFTSLSSNSPSLSLSLSPAQGGSKIFLWDIARWIFVGCHPRSRKKKTGMMMMMSKIYMRFGRRKREIHK
jgi:hypothetical protein